LMVLAPDPWCPIGGSPASTECRSNPRPSLRISPPWPTSRFQA
jgi:hypothetical protein